MFARWQSPDCWQLPPAIGGGRVAAQCMPTWLEREITRTNTLIVQLDLSGRRRSKRKRGARHQRRLGFTVFPSQLNELCEHFPFSNLSGSVKKIRANWRAPNWSQLTRLVFQSRPEVPLLTILIPIHDFSCPAQSTNLHRPVSTLRGIIPPKIGGKACENSEAPNLAPGHIALCRNFDCHLRR